MSRVPQRPQPAPAGGQLIFHFDFRTYFRMLRLAFLEPNPRGRRRMLFVLLVVIPVASSLTALCFLLDGLVFPGLWRVRVERPVFIIGHARSGTTLVHRLMAADADRYSCFLFYEMFLPSLLQKKAVRAIAALDRRFGGALERRVRAWEERRFGKTNDVHRMGLTLAEEDDFVLTLSCASGWWIVQLPVLDQLDFFHVDERPARRRRRLMQFYRRCIQRQLYLNGTDKIHLSKNPTFCGRVESLIETFPDARIVYTARNPYETIPSLLKLLRLGWSMRHWSEQQMNASLQKMAQISFESYRLPLEALERHPEIVHAIVDYRELVEDPEAAIEQVYRRFDLPISDSFGRLLKTESERARTHRSAHRYSLEEFGLDADAIHSELAGLFERFGWQQRPS